MRIFVNGVASGVTFGSRGLACFLKCLNEVAFRRIACFVNDVKELVSWSDVRAYKVSELRLSSLSYTCVDP